MGVPGFPDRGVDARGGDDLEVVPDPIYEVGAGTEVLREDSSPFEHSPGEGAARSALCGQHR